MQSGACEEKMPLRAGRIHARANSTPNHLHNFSINSVSLGNENPFLVLSWAFDKRNYFTFLIRRVHTRFTDVLRAGLLYH